MKFPNRYGCSLDDQWKVTVKRLKMQGPESQRQPATGTPAVYDVGVPQPGSPGLGGGQGKRAYSFPASLSCSQQTFQQDDSR